MVYDKDSTWGREIDNTVSDIWYEDGIRNLTATMSKPTPKFWNTDAKSGLRGTYDDTFEYHQWDILPWDYFIFFKVSRLVPEDVQSVMNYNANELHKSDVHVISNDPRKSPNEYWLKKTGVFVEPRNLLDVQNVMNYNANELHKSDVHVISNDPRKSPNEYWLKKTGVFVEPRNLLRDLCGLAAGSIVVLLWLFAKERRGILISVGKLLSPRRNEPQILRRKQVHDHVK